MGKTTITLEMNVEIEIEYNYTKGRPEVGPAYSHGGLPADPPEVEVTKFTVISPQYESLHEALREVIEDEIAEHEEGSGPDYHESNHDD